MTTGNELLKLIASDASAEDQFGNSVGISAGTAIVGAQTADGGVSGSGSAYIFTPEPSAFSLTALGLLSLLGHRRRKA